VLLVLAVIFVFGAVCGSALTRMYLHPAIVAAHDQGLEGARHLGLKGLKSQLNLTPQQEEVVTRVLDDYAKYYQNIEDERDDVAEHGRRRILDVLTPEQQRKFTQLFGGSIE
jgi:hypothetical protein